MDIQLQREYEIEDKRQFFSFQDIPDHRLIKGYNSSYEVLVNWEYGSVTWEPVLVMRRNDPIYLSKYEHDNHLIYKHGWKQLRLYVKNNKKMNRLLKAAKANWRRNTAKIKFGMKIHRENKEAISFDSDNGNTNWKDAEILELKQMYNFCPFGSLGLVNKARIPPGHAKIQLNIIYDYKQDWRYKACMVASGNMTGTNIDTYYSSVISLFSMHNVVFKLN